MNEDCFSPLFSLEKGELPCDWEKHLLHKKIYISFSGGPDSCALFLLLQRWQKTCGFSLKAIHFNHHLRGDEAEKDALFAEGFARKRNIPFEKIDLFVPEEKLPGEGDEEAARRLRLAKWRELLNKEEDSSLIAFGHQKEDTLENFFLRLARGGNSSSLTALRPFSTLGKLHFFRPLLAFSKKELESFLQKEGVTKWCIDKTNLEADYCRRNFFRNTLFPLLEKEIPGFSAGLGKSLSALSLDAGSLEDSAQKAFQNLSETPHAKEFLSLPEAVAFRVLRLFLTEKLGERGRTLPDFNVWKRFRKAAEKGIKNGPGRENHYTIPLPGIEENELVIANGILAIRPKEKGKTPSPVPLYITEEELKNEKQIKKMWGEYLFTFQLFTEKEYAALPEEEKRSSGKTKAFFDMDEILFPLYFAPRKEGEKMIPFGKNTPIPLKKLFNEYKIPSPERSFYPLFRNGDGRILMIPFIRRSSLAPLQEETRIILYFSAEKLASKGK